MALHRKYDKKNCVICHLQVVIIPKLQFVIFKYIKKPRLATYSTTEKNIL